jgi:RNA polymerase sigma-70 factor (ECF subfamily)
VTTQEALGDLARVEGGRILAVLARTTGDLQLAEDAVQDAVVAALEVWPRVGVPANPSAWLYVAARRKALDVLRREQRRGEKETAAVIVRDPPEPSVVRDDQLRLIFTCTHPALDLDTRVALALRTLCGLSTAEVARALLVSEPTMAKRLVRAKRKIATAGIPYRIPDAADLPVRLAGVAAVIHLVYTAGHAATGTSLLRADLCDEAVRLARLLADLVPDDPLPEALLALLLLSEARRPTRLDGHGELVPLAEQDRARWDVALAAEGIALLDRSLTRSDGLADPYQLQAAIAACHTEAPTYEATDWREIVRLYGMLGEVHPNPVVDINAAVAVLEADGPVAALGLLDAVPEAARSYLWEAARGEALGRLGDRAASVAAFGRAAASAPSDPERRHLERRASSATG